MRFGTTAVGDVLRRMHGADEAMASGPRALGRADVRYLCGVGLGPIAWSLTDAGRLAVPEECRETLHGAELTTRLIHRKMTLTAAELVDELRLAGVVPVLIKGISTSDQFYDPPHHRVMGDVDVLVEAAALEPAASVMKKLRYAAIGATPPDGAQWDHHHLPAARHPDSGVVVELHTGLFPPGSSAAGEPLFQVSHFREYLCESEFQGRSVYRFTPEFQLAYTVAHWAGDRKWPSNVISINDVLHIIRRSAGFDWRLIDDWMRDSDWLAAGISVMLRYLIDCGLIRPAPVLQDNLQHHVRRLGRTNLSFLEWLFHAVPIGGRRPVGGALSPDRALLVWRTMLEPRSRYARIPCCIGKAMFRKRVRDRFNPLVLMRKLRKLARSKVLGG